MTEQVELKYDITPEEIVRSYRRALEDAKRHIAALRAATDRKKAEQEYFLAGGILTNDMMFMFLFRNEALEKERAAVFEDLLKANSEFYAKQNKKENSKSS